MDRSDCGSIHTDLQNFRPRLELQFETPKIVGASVVITTGSTCGEMEPLESAVAVAAKFDRAHV